MTKNAEDSDTPLTVELKRYIRQISHEAALVGVASADRFEGAPRGHAPRDFIPDAKAVVVIGLPIVTGLMDLDGLMEESDVVKEEDIYLDRDGVTRTWNPRRALRNHIERRCSHEMINIELQTLSMYGAMFLERAGFKSIYLPTTYGQTFSWPKNFNKDLPSPPNGFAPFSHRHAAVVAGLGEFGLNNLVLTAEYGPRNRFVSIITEAGLTPDPLIGKSVCLGEKCSLCLSGCNGGAFGDIYDFEVGGRINCMALIDRDACVRASEGCNKKCITACPIGKKPDQNGKKPPAK